MSVPYNGLIADLTPPFQRGKNSNLTVTLLDQLSMKRSRFGNVQILAKGPLWMCSKKYLIYSPTMVIPVFLPSIENFGL